MTLSTPMKIVALVALAVALGMGGVLMLGSHKSTSEPLVVPHVVVRQVAPKTKPHKAPLHLDANLPAPVRRALLHSREVVAVVYSSRVPDDRAVVTEAHAGSRAARVGFAALNVSANATATAVTRWTSTVAAPTVLVVRRPGTVLFSVSGPTDRDTVAQAALSAR